MAAMFSAAPKPRPKPAPHRLARDGRPAAPAWLARVALLLAAAAALWLAFWSIDFTFVQTSRLSSRLELRERMRAHRSAFSLAGGDGGFVSLPAPSRIDVVEAQAILRDGVTVHEIDWRGGPGAGEQPKEMEPHPSPDERHVALEDRRMATNAGHHPIELLDVATGRSAAIVVPGSVARRAQERYPLRFHAWSADSRRALVRFDGSGKNAHDLAVLYRELWAVDVADLRPALVRRCEVPSYGAPTGEANWRGTPCERTAQ